MRNEGDDFTSSEGPGAEEFGAYLVFERLGRGGMATVHRAKKRGIAGFERVVALKRMLPHLSADPEFVRSFVHEAKLASLLVHPNIAQIYDLGRIDDVYYIAMEHVAGFDLNRLLRYCYHQDELPPLNVALSILCELCEALEYAHTLSDNGQPYGIVHRDVSPSNLMVAHTGHLKVIDFGIAKARARPLHTDDGRIKGKLGYMAPEAIEGRPIGPSSDVFSAGVVAHELLTAERLFHARTDHEMLQHVRQREIPPPSDKNPHVPASLDRVVMAALERDERRRLQSAGEFRRALAAVAGEAGMQFSATDVAEWWATSGALYEDKGARESRPSSSRNASMRGLPRLVELSARSSADDLAGSDVQRLGAADRRPAMSAPRIASAPERVRWRARAGLLLAGLCTSAVGLAAYHFLLRPTPAVAPAAPAPPTEQPRRALVKFVVHPMDAIVEIGGGEVTRQSPFELALEPGVYSIAVSHPGYKRWTSDLTLQDRETKTINVALEPTPAIVGASSEPAVPVTKLDGKVLNQVTSAEVTASPGPHRMSPGKRSSGTATGVARTAPPVIERTPPRASSGSTTRAPAGRDAVAQVDERSVESVPEPATVKPLSQPEAPPKPTAPTAVVPVPSLPAVPQRARPATPALVPASAITKLSGEVPDIQRGSVPTDVLAKICIGTDGHVTSVKVVRASPRIATEIERSLLGWRYKPYVDDSGHPSPACFAVRLVFERGDGR